MNLAKTFFTFFPDESTLVSGRLLTTIPILYKTWNVTFEVFPSKFAAKCSPNVLYMTVNVDGSSYGDRTPAVFFCKDKLYIYSGVDGNWNSVYISKSFKVNTWIKVQVTQKVEYYKYHYLIYLDDIKAHDVVNTQTQEFNGVKVYVTKDATAGAQEGKIRNLVIKTQLGEYFVNYSCSYIAYFVYSDSTNVSIC